MERDELTRYIEAILFASGEPVPAAQIAAVLDVPAEDVLAAGESLSSQLSYERRGVRVLRLENDLQMISAAEYGDVVARALETRKPPKLSASALETLTIISYYQPTTKAFVEQIRGVDSSYTISSLLRRELISAQGKLKVPGRPILYGTTDTFLRTFGLTSIEDLPPADLPRDKLSLEELQKETEATLAAEKPSKEAGA